MAEELWAVVGSLLPEPPKPKGETPRVPDRAALAGTLFVLKSGIPWKMLPQQMGRRSGMTRFPYASRSSTKPACGLVSPASC